MSLFSYHTFVLILLPLVLLLLPIIYCTPSSQLSSPFSTTTIPTPYHTTPHHKQAHQNFMRILPLSHVWLGWGCCRSIWSKVRAYQSYFGSSPLSFRYLFFLSSSSHSYHSLFLSFPLPLITYTTTLRLPLPTIDY